MHDSAKDITTITAGLTGNASKGIANGVLNTTIIDQLGSSAQTDIDSAYKSLAKSFNEATVEANALKMAQNGLDEATVQGTLSAKGYTEQEIQAALANGEYKAAQASATASTEVNTAATWKNVAAKKALSAASIAANMALGMVVAALASIVINGVITFLYNVTHEEENLAKKAEEASSKINELRSSFNTLKTSTDNLKERYAELAQSVDQLNGKNLTLNDDDYAEFLDLSNQLAELFPSLTKNYDENGNAILDLTGNVDGIVGSLNDLVDAQQKLANQKILDELPTVYAKYAQDLEKAETELNKAKETYDTYVNNANNGFNFSKVVDQWTGDDRYIIDIGKDVGAEYANSVLDQINKTLEEQGLTLEDYYSDQFIDENGHTILQFSAWTDDAANSLANFGQVGTQTFNALTADAKQSLNTAQQEVDKLNGEFKPMLATWLQDTYEYSELLTNSQQSAVQQILSNDSTWIESMYDELGKDASEEDLERWMSNLMSEIANMPDDQKIQLTDLVSGDLSTKDTIDIADQLQQYFDEKGIKISLDFAAKDDKELLNRVKNSVTKVFKNDSNVNNTNAGATNALTNWLSDSGQEINDWIEKLPKDQLQTLNNVVEDSATQWQEATTAISEYTDGLNELKKTADSLSDDQRYFGNVDLYNRPIVDWTDESTKKKYFERANRDWGVSDKDTYSTLLGSQQEIASGVMEGQQIMFTPILANGEILSADTVSQYLEKVLDGAQSEADVLAADKKGIEIGDTYVQGIIEGISSVGQGVSKTVNGLLAEDTSQTSGALAANLTKYISEAYDIASYNLDDSDANELKKEINSMIYEFIGDETDVDKAAKIVDDNMYYILNSADAIIKQNISHVSSDDLYSNIFDNLQAIETTANQCGVSTDEFMNTIISGGNQASSYIALLSSNMDKYNTTQEDSNDKARTFKELLSDDTFSSTANELLELAKSGEITTATLTSTQDYKDLVEELGGSARDAKTQILDMLTPTEKLNAASGTFSSLTSAMDEVKEKGYATATTIAGLPDVIKENTKDYNLFESVIGDPTSTEKEVQEVFSTIAKDYLNSQQTLKGLTEDNKNFYIANLKEMGIANAEELATEYLNNSNTLESLEKDFNDYCEGKSMSEQAFVDWIKNNSGNLEAALGSGYQDDYNNWCDLLAKKGEAYNEFVNAINEANSTAWAMLYGTKELDQQKVEDGTLTMTDLAAANYNSYDAKAVLEAQANYTKTKKALEALKDVLVTDLSTVNVGGGDALNLKSPNSKDTGSPSGTTTEDEETLKDKFDKELAELKHKLAMEEITEKTYYKELDKLNDKYFKGKKDYLDDYRQYEEEVYAGQKKLYIQDFEDEADALKQKLDLNKISEKDYYKELSSLNNKYYKDKDKYADEYEKNRQEIEKGKQTIHIAAFDDKKSDLQHQLDMEEISQETYYKKLSALNEKYFANKVEYAEQYKENQEEIEKGLIEVYKTQLSTYIELQQSKLDAGQISFQKYTSKVETYLKKMYETGKISAETYFSTVRDNLEYQLSIYDKVLAAVNKVYDDEIDKIQDEIDLLEDKNDALNDQKDTYDSILSAVAKVYDDAIAAANDEKQSIQDVLDALSKENDERERQMALQKAQYNLNRALNQNSQKTLTKDGFVYSVDNDAIRSAQEALRDAEYDNTTAALKQQQDDIDSYIDKLNEFKEKWSEIPNAYQEAQDTTNAIMYFGSNYQKQILQNNIDDVNTFKDKYVVVQSQINDNQGLIDSYNEKIQYYSDLKEEWGKVTSAYEDGINKQYADQILGVGWEEGVLEGRIKTLSTFATEYTRIQDEMAKATVAANNAIVESNKAAQKNEKTSYNGSNARTSVEQAIYSQQKANTTNTNAEKAIYTAQKVSQSTNVAQSAIGSAALKLLNKLSGHASGVHNLDEDELAWTQELGDELILSPSTNAILTPLKAGDSVLNAAMTDNLWDWAKMNPTDIIGNKLISNINPASIMKSVDSTTALQFYGNLEFPNITSGNDAQKLVSELLKLRTSNQQYLNRK